MPFFPFSLSALDDITQVKLIRVDAGTADLIWNKEEDVFTIVDSAFFDETVAEAQCASAHHGMGVEIKIVVVLLAKDTAFLSQSHQLLKPTLLLLRHLIEYLFFSGLPFFANLVTFLIEVESPALHEKLLDIAKGRCRILHPGRQIDFRHALHAPAIFVHKIHKILQERLALFGF